MTRGVKGSTQPCVVEGCDGPTKGHGFCGRHYQRWKKYGDPLKMADKIGRPLATHCKRGHEFTEGNTYVDSGGFKNCVVCRRRASERYRDSGKGVAARTSYRVRTSEVIAAKQKIADARRYKLDPAIKARAVAWKKANPGKVNAAHRAWQKRNAEKKREWNRRWRENNHDKVSMQRQRRELRVFAAPGWHTAEQLEQRWAMFGGRCWMCGCDNAKERDHVKPLSKGGSEWPANLRPACRSCNASKGNKWGGAEWLRTLRV